MRFKTSFAALVLCAATALVGPQAEARESSHPQTCQAGGQIVFAADTPEGRQLFTLRPDGSRLHQITHVMGYDVIDPDWSTDGRRIVFQLDSPDVAHLGIVRADGTGYQVLPITAPFVGNPAFTPNGKRIVYERYDGGSLDAIYSSTLTGRHQTQLTYPPVGYGDTEPNPSPDGRTLSFVRIGPGTFDAALFTLDITSGRETQLTAYDADIAIKTGWSPDSRRIVYSPDTFAPKPGVSPNVWTIKRDGTHARPVTNFSGGDIKAFAGSYSPDGRWIIFRREDGTTAGLWTIRPNGQQATLIFTNPDVTPRNIDWGPNPR